MDTQGMAQPELRRSDSLALKNYKKWSTVECHARHPIGGFVPMKLPYDHAKAEHRHSIADIKARFPSVGLVLDLQNQDDPYRCTAWPEMGMLNPPRGGGGGGRGGGP